MILFRYVLREYFRYVIGTVALCVFLFVLFDFMHKASREFADFQPSGIAVARFYFYQLPFQVIQALPIASLLASVVSMALLSRGNEVTVMRAAGMGPWTISLPLVVGGSILSVFSFLVGEYLVPPAARKMHYVQDVVIKGRSNDDLERGARWVRDKDRFVNFQDFDPKAGVLTGVKIIEVDSQFRPETITRADRGVHVPTQGNWRLEGVSVTEIDSDGMIRSRHESEAALSFLPIEPQRLKRERRRPEEMSTPELAEMIHRGEESGRDVLGERIALSTKWAYPFAAVLVSLMGLRFGYRSERSNETMRNVLVAFLVGISYWFILSAARALGIRGDISPAMAAWSANAAIGSVVGYQLWALGRF